MVKHTCWHGHSGAFSIADFEAQDRAIYDRELLSWSPLSVSTHCGRKFGVVAKPLRSGRVWLPLSGCVLCSQKHGTESIVLPGRAAFLSGSDGVPEAVILYVCFLYKKVE